MIASWPSPAGEEYALLLDQGRAHRILVLPALFEEANRMRHFAVETMRLLQEAGVDSFLPDLPGCNESTAPLEQQDLSVWTEAAVAAATHFGATHVLALRGGALLAPSGLPGWRLGNTSGRSLLGTMLRARTLSAKEAGIAEDRQALLEKGRDTGLTLSGHRLGPAMIRQLEDTTPVDGLLQDVSASDLGGAPLWLRAEPDHDPQQARRLAQRIMRDLSA